MKILDKRYTVVAQRGHYDEDGKVRQHIEVSNREYSNTLTTVQKDSLAATVKVLVKTNTQKGYEEAYEGDSINLEFPNSKTRRGRVGRRVSQTLMTKDSMGVVVTSEISDVRKLTPKEYFRLMGFDDSDVDLLMKNGMSNTQLYKMAGNSIVVNVLEFLFCQIFDSDNEIWV